jgi:transcriptional regulator with XRE-family HTH domain|tara:strand:- start:14011 stop:14256 length:246 start_codon:yes stop_codon:yes gene_type:complete
MNDSESLNEFLIKFGEKVKKERESRGLTLDDLEFHSSIDSSDINKIELGQRNITMKSLLRISHGLKVHPKELLDIEFTVSE